MSYLSDRKMRVKFNGETSQEHQLIGCGPQGTLLGGIEYLVQSNDNSDCLDQEDRFKYVDDLSLLEVLFLTGLLVDYDYLTMSLQILVQIRSFYPLKMFKLKIP